MEDEEKAIIVQDLFKSFKLPNEKDGGLKNALLNITKKKSSKPHGYEIQHVLKDITFDIKKGEFFGIVGRNGSGKSTLLKLLAGIYSPDKGIVKTNGSLTPFIELGVGFNPELTGRENIYLNGALLGFSKEEVTAMYNDIVDFAELERFMDQKLKNYSSGMQVRLAFSIAIRANSDILLFDEVLAVGDAAFQQKCYEAFADMKEKGTTIILVTHDMGAVQRFCDRAILIEQGVIKLEGSPMDIADLYLEENFEEKNDDNEVEKIDNSITDVRLLNKVHSLDIGDEVQIEFTTNPVADKKYHIGFQIFRSDGVYVYGTNTKNNNQDSLMGTKKHKIVVPQQLSPGNYHIFHVHQHASVRSYIWERLESWRYYK